MSIALPFFVVILSQPVLVKSTLVNWTVDASSSLPVLPRSTYGAALCYNESMQTLHILGGQEYPSQWVQYDAAQNQFNDNGREVLSENITRRDAGYYEHSSTYWAQVSGILYYIHDHNSTHSSNRNYQIHQLSIGEIGQANSMQYWQDIPYYTQTWDHCVTAHEGHDQLIVVGGMSPGLVNRGVTNMAIYDFTAQRWLTGLPLMQQQRQKPSCVVNTAENALYVSGGEHFGALSSTEKVSLTNISSQSWDYIAGSLTVAVYGHVMVYYPDDNTILVIGGWDDSNARDEIQRIDCETGAVTVIGALEIAVARPAFVYIAHLRRIYLFGGKVADGQGTDRMQIVEALVPTNEPTAAPTSKPSASPTRNPTMSPTSAPSSNPTLSPTPTPTSDPTSSPSFTPTVNPTANPSFYPSTSRPTNPPSQTPTEHPQHSTKDNFDDNETNESLLQWNSPIVIGCILAVFFAFILIACVGVCWYRRASKNQVDTAIQNMEGKVDAAAAAGALPQNGTPINDALPQANATQPSLVYGESTAAKDKPQTFLGNGLSEAELIADDETDESVLDGVVFPTKGEAVDEVQVQMAPMSGRNIAQFCEDAQFDAEVVGDDEVTRGGPSANRN